MRRSLQNAITPSNKVDRFQSAFNFAINYIYVQTKAFPFTNFIETKTELILSLILRDITPVKLQNIKPLIKYYKNTRWLLS